LELAPDRSFAEAHQQLRRRLDRAMRAQVAIAWRTLRELGHPEAIDAFKP